VKKNEGEGSPSAARNYRKGVEKYVKSHKVDEAADDAAQDIHDEHAAHEKDCSSESCAADAPIPAPHEPD
jgi:hypothetical protein